MSTISTTLRDLLVFIILAQSVTGCAGGGVDMQRNEKGQIVKEGTTHSIAKKVTNLAALDIQQLKITGFTNTCDLITAVVSVINNSALIASPSFAVNLQGTIQRINVTNQFFAPLVISQLRFPALQPHNSVSKHIQIPMPINMLPISTGKFTIYDYTVWLSAEAVQPMPGKPIDLSREAPEMNSRRYASMDIRCTIIG